MISPTHQDLAVGLHDRSGAKLAFSSILRQAMSARQFAYVRKSRFRENVACSLAINGVEADQIREC